MRAIFRRSVPEGRLLEALLTMAPESRADREQQAKTGPSHSEQYQWCLTSVGAFHFFSLTVQTVPSSPRTRPAPSSRIPSTNVCIPPSHPARSEHVQSQSTPCCVTGRVPDSMPEGLLLAQAIETFDVLAICRVTDKDGDDRCFHECGPCGKLRQHRASTK